MRVTLLSGLFWTLSFACQADVTHYFNSIKSDPNALYAFFRAMPKGGELHYHLSGSAYPETMLDLAGLGDFCINTTDFAATIDGNHCQGVKTGELFSKPDLYDEVVRSWSLKDFIPGKETRASHFFNAFFKFHPIVLYYDAELLADCIKRAARQQEQYLEVMVLADRARSLHFAPLIAKQTTLESKRATLLADKAFQDNIHYAVSEAKRVHAKAYDNIGCNKEKKPTACQVKVQLLTYILREQPLDSVFAQALTAFEAVAASGNTLVGVNLVQAEDGLIALRDYRKQMAIFQFLHKLYPQVAITLHAGELAASSVVPANLNFHIRDALLVGQAQRIGHGVSIAYEKDVEKTVQHMAEKGIAVEVNLTSNRLLLGVKGPQHPLHYYLNHQVPVVLSTDDEGLLRTDLTRQYVAAVLEQGLDYPTIKQINRNALTYAFLSGKSLWANAASAHVVPECLDLNSTTCLQFIAHSEKARLQRQLEIKLAQFEVLVLEKEPPMFAQNLLGLKSPRSG
jgi:adenosine deaminase